MIAKLKAGACYLYRRITEHSSMAAIGAAVLQAAVVPAPYSYLFIGFAAFQVLLPDGRVAKGPDDVIQA